MIRNENEFEVTGSRKLETFLFGKSQGIQTFTFI